MAQFHLHVTTPEGNVWDADADAVNAFGIDGHFGILPNHAPIIAALKPGVLKVDQGDQTHYFAAGEGVLEVRMDKDVVLLLEYAEPCSSAAEAREKVREANQYS